MFVLAVLLALMLVQIVRKPTHITSLRDKHVVITGGSSGIGFALAKTCLSEGAFVTLIARNQQKLSSAAIALSKTERSLSDRILLKAVDVSDAAAVSLAIKESFSWKPFDIVICNAGMCLVGHLDALNVKDLDSVANTNFMGCVYTIHAALPLMKSRSQKNPSSIVFMSSLAGLVFVFGFNIYTSTKYALKGLAESLRIELMPHNIRVSLVCPGFTETPMLDQADEIASNSELLQKLCHYDRASAQSPDEVAKKTMEGVKKGDFLITTSFKGFLAGLLARGFLPAESLATALVELILLVPMRLFTHGASLYMRRAVSNNRFAC